MVRVRDGQYDDLNSIITDIVTFCLKIMFFKGNLGSNRDILELMSHQYFSRQMSGEKSDFAHCNTNDLNYMHQNSGH